MSNRSFVMFGAILALIIFSLPFSAAGDGLITPEISVRAGASYQSTQFDYTSAYLKYLRAHGTDVGFEEQFIRKRTENDIFLDEASIGILAKIGEHVAGRASWIYERISGKDEEEITLDRAYVAFLTKNFSIALGRDYLDIAEFASQSVFDSWTLKLAETRADALVAKFDGFLMKLWGSVLKGQYPAKPEKDEQIIEDYAAGIELKPFAMRKDMSLKLGATYLGDICETKYGFGELITKSAPETVFAFVDTNGDGTPDSWVEVTVGERKNVYERRVDLWTIYEYFLFSLSPDVELGLDIEYSLAGRSFKNTDLADSMGREAKPAVYNAELWVKLYEVLDIAARMQGAKDFHPFLTSADEARELGPIVAFLLGKNLTISLEYMYGKDSDEDTWHQGALGVELKL